MDAPIPELVCPRCGEEFPLLVWREVRASREAWDRFAHHAQREHDLDEVEAYALLFGGRRVASPAT